MQIRDGYFCIRQNRRWLIKFLFHFPLQHSILCFASIKIQVYFLCCIFSISSLNLSAVSEAMTTLMEHALYQNPSQPSWLRTQADIHFGKYNYGLDYESQIIFVLNPYSAKLGGSGGQETKVTQNIMNVEIDHMHTTNQTYGR